MGKSTATHACVLAPDEVTIYSYPVSFYFCQLQIYSLHHYIQFNNGKTTDLRVSIDTKIIFPLTIFIQGGSKVPRKRKGTGFLQWVRSLGILSFMEYFVKTEENIFILKQCLYWLTLQVIIVFPSEVSVHVGQQNMFWFFLIKKKTIIVYMFNTVSTLIRPCKVTRSLEIQNWK